jgi:hypothetical protein
MKRKLEIIGLCIGWFAIIGQFVLMLQNRQTDIPEMVIRFFSFFTILTNTLVTLYFTASFLKLKTVPFKWLLSNGTSTALTAFILIVGLVYQLVLRKIWNPTGLQYIVDELLHSVIPLFMLGYWFFNLKKDDLLPKPIINWLLYPVLYITFIMTRGHFSGFYPYPFLNVNEIGYHKGVINIGIVFAVAFIILTSLILVGKTVIKNKQKPKIYED